MENSNTNPESVPVFSPAGGTGGANATPQVIFKIIAALAIVALILSISRLFLSESDRGMLDFYYNYNVYISSQMTAFLSVGIASAVFILIGTFLKKDYDIIGSPFIIAGVFSLVFISIMAYLSKGLTTGVTDAGQLQGDIALTAIIILEWIGLFWYLWSTFPPKTSLLTLEK